MPTWYGLLGPARLPSAVAEKWQKDVAKVIAMPDVAKRIAGVAGEPRGTTPDAFATYLKTENEKMGKLVKDANVRAE